MPDRHPPADRSARTSISEHRATKAIEVATTNPSWINAALIQCQKDVNLARDAASADNHKGAVTNAYDAIRVAVECQMNADGLRIANSPGSHRVAVDYAAERMPRVFDDDRLHQYEQLRALRHTSEYPFSASTRVAITRQDATMAIALADHVVKAVIKTWAAKPKKRAT